jgi:hypothetical protein
VRATIFGCLTFAVACKTPLTAHRDAGHAADAGHADLAVDSPWEAAPDPPATDATPDRAPTDLTPANVPPDRAAGDPLAPDLASPPGVPTAFRFINHTGHLVYVDANDPVACSQDTPAGWTACRFFTLGCLFSCDAVPANGDCCILCERPLPALFAIPPGESQSVPWNGRIYAAATGTCAACQCQQETVVDNGAFEASASVFADYQCAPLPCETGPDGTITHAEPLGGSLAVSATFSVPYERNEVVLDITSRPAADAGPAQDLATADLATTGDRPTDTALPGFPEIPGQTFAIAAGATPPDASARFGSACRPADLAARYDLRFSTDGTMVSIVRTDPVQEAVLEGSLYEQFDTRLVYRIVNGFAGELVIWRDDGSLIAQLSRFGSGVPVIWCIESPMTSP